MITIYYSYRYLFDPQNNGNRYTPSYTFVPQYTELQGVATMTDELIAESQYKILPNGQISGVRIGKLEYDETILASFGKDETYLKNELARVGSNFALINETNATLAEFIRNYTNLVEVSTNVFKLADAYIDTMTNLEVTEKLLNLN